MKMVICNNTIIKKAIDIHKDIHRYTLATTLGIHAQLLFNKNI